MACNDEFYCVTAVLACDVCVAAVNKHLAGEQCRAAVKIQAHWKGYRTRRGITSRRLNVDRTRAATVIQRTVSCTFIKYSSVSSLC